MVLASESPAAGRVRRTQQERRSDAEARLLASAMELIAEQGVARTSLAEIGERAGFSRGIVNHHFGTKAELVKQLISESRRGFNEAIAQRPEGTGLEAILAIVDIYMERLKRAAPSHRAFLVMWAEAAAAGEDVRASFIEGDRLFRSRLSELVELGVRDGSIRADAKPGAVAAGLVGQLRGLGLEVLVDPEGFDVESIRADVFATISASLATPARAGNETL